MKRVRIVLSLAWISILVLGSVLTACSGDSGNEIVYYEETKILTQEEADNIAEVTGNRSSIVFSENTAFVAGLESGDVLVCEYPVPGAESGFLERVTGVSTMGYGVVQAATGLANGGTVVEIEPATMEDAIEEAEFSINTTIPIDDLMSDLMWATGVEVLQVSGGKEFTYYPTEGVTIEGYLRFTADADVHVDLSFWGRLEEFEFVFSPGLEMGANLTVEAGATWEKEYTLAEITGPPIPVWGPVSVIPELALIVGTTATLEASFEAAVTYDRSYDVGISFYRNRNPQWDTISNVYGEGVTLGEPSFSGHVEALVYGGVELSATTGIGVAEAGLGADLLGNIEASGDAQASPWQWQYDLEMYLSAHVFAELKLLRIATIRWDSDPWEFLRHNLAYGASGRVTIEGGAGLADVEISFSGDHPSVFTDGDGYWCKHLLSGDVVATPHKTGYEFDPPSRTVTGSASNLDFQVAQYDLTISSTAGGSVITPGEGTFAYDPGTVVDLVATPVDSFVEWNGDVSTIADVNNATTTITMNDNYDITANFEASTVIFSDDFEYYDSLENHGWTIGQSNPQGDPQTATDPENGENRVAYIQSREEDFSVFPSFYHSFSEPTLQPGMEISIKFYDTGDSCHHCDVWTWVYFDNDTDYFMVGWYGGHASFAYGYEISGSYSGELHELYGLRDIGWHEFVWRVEESGGIDLLIDGNLVVDDLAGFTTLSKFQVISGSDSNTYSFSVDDFAVTNPG